MNSEVFFKTIEEFENQLKNGTISSFTVKKALTEYKEWGDRLKELFQCASELKREDKDIYRYYKQFAGYKASELVEKLRGKGYFLGKDKEIREAFENHGYRLLEQVRAGKRDVVFHGILRIFVSMKREFPQELVEAFKPVYSDEMFKVFLFSFLSGILGKEETQE